MTRLALVTHNGDENWQVVRPRLTVANFSGRATAF